MSRQRLLSERVSPLVVPDKVAVIDIDGTLIDKDYAITDERIYDAVQNAQDAGWKVGLSSDTPFGKMQEWHELFGMNGPIIAEKGAFVAFGDQTIETAKTPFDFVRLRETFLAQVALTDTLIYRGDAVKLFRENIETLGHPGDEIVLANTLRNYSTGYFARRVGEDGRMYIDEAQTNKFADQIRALYPSGIDFDEDLNHEHGLLIISHKGMHKRIGTIALENLLGVERIAMIGNSIADYVGTDIASQLAVGDATPEYKEVADFVAKGEVTSGVIESLTALVENNK